MARLCLRVRHLTLSHFALLSSSSSEDAAAGLFVAAVGDDESSTAAVYVFSGESAFIVVVGVVSEVVLDVDVDSPALAFDSSLEAVVVSEELSVAAAVF